MNSATFACAYLLTLQQEHEKLHITSVCRGNHLHDLIISLTGDFGHIQLA
jgi:hypothetical protein